MISHPPPVTLNLLQAITIYSMISMWRKTDCYTCRQLLAFYMLTFQIILWVKEMAYVYSVSDLWWPSLTIRLIAWSLKTLCKWCKNVPLWCCKGGVTSVQEALLGTSKRQSQLCPFLPCSKGQWREGGSQFLWLAAHISINQSINHTQLCLQCRRSLEVVSKR